MYFTEALRVLLRRWYVILAGAAVMALAGVGITHYVPTQYQASGSLLLVLPVEANGVAGPINPFLNLQEGLNTTASIIASSVGTKDTQRALAKGGFSASYSAEVLPGTGPIVVVTTKSASPSVAIKTRDQVISRLNKRLATLQTALDVPQAQVITLLPTNVDAAPEVLPGSKIKALVAVGVGVGVLTLVIAFVLDGWRRARLERPRNGRRSKTEPLDEEPPATRKVLDETSANLPSSVRRKTLRGRNQTKRQVPQRSDRVRR